MVKIYTNEEYTKSYTELIEILKYFVNILNTKVCFLSSEEIVNSLNEKSSSKLKILKYSNLKNFLEELNDIKDIPFKCIIDLSNLFTYEILKNIIEFKDFKYLFDSIFPNSIYIKEWSKNSFI